MFLFYPFASVLKPWVLTLSHTPTHILCGRQSVSPVGRAPPRVVMRIFFFFRQILSLIFVVSTSLRSGRGSRTAWSLIVVVVVGVMAFVEASRRFSYFAFRARLLNGVWRTPCSVTK